MRRAVVHGMGAVLRNKSGRTRSGASIMMGTEMTKKTLTLNCVQSVSVRLMKACKQ